MTVQACLLTDDATAAAAEALNAQSQAINGGTLEARKVDNAVANQIVGLGAITGAVLGLNYFPARILIDPMYSTFLPVLQNQPIYVLESELLFLPQTEV